MSEEYVDISSGSGLVHMAPGCGPEDYEVGHRNNIPPWNLVEEDGFYNDKMGPFSGLHAIKDNNKFTNFLKKKNAIVAEQLFGRLWPAMFLKVGR